MSYLIGVVNNLCTYHPINLTSIITYDIALKRSLPTTILYLTNICTIRAETHRQRHVHRREQIIGVLSINLESSLYAIVQQAKLCTDVHLLGCLPTKIAITKAT